MPVEAISINDIIVLPNRMRALRADKVDEFTESIRERGLIEPILVCPVGDHHELVVGHHRLEAVRKLGWSSIDSIITDASADEAKLIEIDENLIRADLSPAERAMHLAERKRLYLKMHPETASVRVRGGPGRGKKNQSDSATGFPSFMDDTAGKTGKHRTTIAREIARAAIPNLRDVIGTSLDTPDELDALTTLPPEAQTELIGLAKDGIEPSAKHMVKFIHRKQRERELAEATEEASRTLGT